MLRMVVIRIISSLVAVIGASLIAFVLLRVFPADPARLIVGPFASEQVIEAQRESLGLNDPIYMQYVTYMSDFVQGDWGYSYSAGEPVSDQVISRLPATAELALYAFAFTVIGAVVVALVTTYRRRRVADAAVNSIAFLGLGTPPFWLGLVALLVFFDFLDLLPGPEGRLGGVDPPPEVTHFVTIDALLAGQWGTFVEAGKHVLLPAIVLGFAPFSFLVRLLRANLLEVSHELYITVARSKGFGRWTAFRRHALPNALLPTLTAAGLILAQLLAGSVLVEVVFDWPGVGALVVDGILRQDFAVVQAFILIGAFSYVLVNLVVDILYGVIDPRTRTVSAVAR
jgi:ABC-type dipeptide/oligopeptide/nickel transport system permease component